MTSSFIQNALAVRPSQRQLDWQALEFIAFIHFGINTFYDQEWGTGKENPQRFNPDSLDADQWVVAIKEAEMKGLILTCKHHDGFCLWPSTYTQHSVKSSPWQNGNGDVVGQVAQACRRHGLKFGVYLSPWDLHHPDYGSGKAYDDYFCHQLQELLTQYGDIFEVWFDGANGQGPNGKVQTYDWARYFQLVRDLQPDAVIAIMGPDVRWIGNEAGKVRPSEWSVLPKTYADPHYTAQVSQQELDQNLQDFADLTSDDLGSRQVLADYSGDLIWYPGETDVSIRPGWFYHADQDQAVKSAQRLFQLYLRAVGGNSLLLLNIPPNPQGLIADPDLLQLNALGKIIRQFKSRLTPLDLKQSSWSNDLLIEEQVGSLTPGPDGSLGLACHFAHPLQIDALVLKEDIRKGQRIESGYCSLYHQGHLLATYPFTTIGYQKIIALDSETTIDCIKLTLTTYRGHQVHLKQIALARI